MSTSAELDFSSKFFEAVLKHLFVGVDDRKDKLIPYLQKELEDDYKKISENHFDTLDQDIRTTIGEGLSYLFPEDRLFRAHHHACDELFNDDSPLLYMRNYNGSAIIAMTKRFLPKDSN